MQEEGNIQLRSRLSVPGPSMAFRKKSRVQGQGALIAGPDSIQRRSDFLIACLKESSDAERKQYFIDLGDLVFSDEKIFKEFTGCLLDLFFHEMDQRR